jgi:hypothetical protein
VRGRTLNEVGKRGEEQDKEGRKRRQDNNVNLRIGVKKGTKM